MILIEKDLEGKDQVSWSICVSQWKHRTQHAQELKLVNNDHVQFKQMSGDHLGYVQISY